MKELQTVRNERRFRLCSLISGTGSVRRSYNVTLLSSTPSIVHGDAELSNFANLRSVRAVEAP